MEATKKRTEDVGTSTDESKFEAVEKSSNIGVRQNTYGQVKTNCNQKCPKAPLRRSERNKGKKQEQVSYNVNIKSIQYFQISVTIN